MTDIRTDSEGRVIEVRKSSSAGWLLLVLAIVLVAVAAFAFGFINIDQTQTARLPDVKVETSGGQAPAFDVDTAKIDVGTETRTIEVPTVSVEKADDKK